MAVKRIKQRFAYGLGDDKLRMGPLPIVAQRAPGTSDIAEIGTTWVDESAGAHYVLTRVVAGSATWEGASSGSGTFTAVTANPGDITATDGDIIATLGDLNIAAGNATIGGDLTVTGTLSFSGDLDLSSAALIDLVSTLNAAPSILLHANGGAAEQIYLHSDQGTTVNSILLGSDVGGITLLAGLASDDAINITASSGGVDIDAALQINIASSENAVDAIVINASAGGIDITAAGAATEDIDITNTSGSININSGEVIADSMILTSAGGLDFVVAGTGSLDIDMVNTAGSVNISSAEAVADAIVLNASDGAGGVIIQAGTGGILVGNEADTTPISVGDIAPTASRTITVGGGTVITAAVTDTIDIAPDGATTNANSIKTVNIGVGGVTIGENNVNIGTGNRTSGTHLVALSTGTGTKTVNAGNADGLTTVNIDAITLINDSINVATSINTGTSTGTVSIGNGAAGAVTLDSGAGVSLDGAAASNFTTSGAGIDLTLDSAAGSVVIDGGEAILTAVTIIASDAGGGIDMDSGTTGTILDSTGPISLDGAAASNFTVTGAGIDLTLSSVAGEVVMDGGEAAATAVTIIASDAAGGIDMDSGTTGTIIDSTGAISLDAAAASNFTTTGAGIDLTVSSVAGLVVIDGGEAAVDAVDIDASDAAGGIDMDSGTGGTAIDSTGAISIDGAAASNFAVSGASIDLTLASAAGSVLIDGGEAAVDAVEIDASDAAGGIDIDSGTGGITIDTTGALSLDAAAASNFTLSGAGIDLTLRSDAGSVFIHSGESAAQAIYLHADGGAAETIHLHADQGTLVNSIDLESDVGGITLQTGLASNDAINFQAVTGGIDMDADLQIGIHSTQSSVTAIDIQATNAAGGINIDSGTGGLIFDTTGAISLDSAAASNFTVTGAFDLTLDSTAGSVIIDGGEAVVDAVTVSASDAAGGIDIDSGTGGITIDSTGAVSIDAAAASNFTVTGAGIDLTLDSAAGRVIVNGEEAAANAITLLSAAGGIDADAALQINIASSQAAADAIVINASNAAGGVDISTGGGSVDVASSGFFTCVPGTATDATGPAGVAAVTINTDLGLATLTGFTTAAGADLVLTVTNSQVAAGSGIFVSCSTLGGNDCQLTVMRILPGAGTFDVTLTNNGAAACNGTILVSFWRFA